LSSDRPRSVYEKGYPPPRGSPDSLIATQAINGCTEKFIRFLGRVAAIDSNGRTIWIADAHRDDGKRFVVRADEKLTAFVELDFADCVPGFAAPKRNYTKV
jgi:hypothetical protein